MHKPQFVLVIYKNTVIFSCISKLLSSQLYPYSPYHTDTVFLHAGYYYHVRSCHENQERQDFVDCCNLAFSLIQIGWLWLVWNFPSLIVEWINNSCNHSHNQSIVFVLEFLFYLYIYFLTSTDAFLSPASFFTLFSIGYSSDSDEASESDSGSVS